MSKVTKFPGAVHDFYKPLGDAEDHVFNTVGPSLTRQEFAEECDINSLMSRYDAHVIGGPGNMAPANPMYVDFTHMPGNLLDYMEFMKTAEQSFMSLPAVVRREFDNSAPAFVDFASDPENLEQMRTWGLAPPKVETPVQVPGPAPAAEGGSAPPKPAVAG